MAAPSQIVAAAGRGSRWLHHRGLMFPTASGGVRLLAGKVAPHGSYTYRNQFGHQVRADLGDYMERIGFFGAHGSALIRYATSHLQPGDWAIDAGANVGLMASPLAAAVGPSGCVWAVEPLPRNVARLEELKAANGLGQLEILPLALGSVAATARLHLSSRPGGSGSGSFVAPWGEEAFVEVATARLDDLVAARSPRGPLRLVKIDVEGYEAELLKGAEATLRGHRPLVICEFHDPLLRAAGSSSEDLLARFAALGYTPRAPFDRPEGSLDAKVLDLLLAPAASR